MVPPMYNQCVTNHRLRQSRSPCDVNPNRISPPITMTQDLPIMVHLYPAQYCTYFNCTNIICFDMSNLSDLHNFRSYWNGSIVSTICSLNVGEDNRRCNHHHFIMLLLMFCQGTITVVGNITEDIGHVNRCDIVCGYR